MYQFLIKRGEMVGFGLAALAIIITIVPLFGGMEAFDMVAEKQQPWSDEGDIFMVGINVSIWLFVIAVATIVVLGILGIFKDPKSSIKGVIGFVVLAAFFGILYATATTDVSGELAKIVADPQFGMTDNIYKMVSGGITGTIILLFIAAAAMVLMEIWSFFKTA